MKKLILCCFIVQLLQVIPLQGQQLILQSVSGGGAEYVHMDGQFHWNLGEVCIREYASGEIGLSEGFLQTFDLISKVLLTPMNLSVTLFPNPVAESLNFRFDDGTHDPWIIRVWDAQGRFIRQQMVSSSILRMDFSRENPGCYYISAWNKANQETQINKIIKIK